MATGHHSWPGSAHGPPSPGLEPQGLPNQRPSLPTSLPLPRDGENLAAAGPGGGEREPSSGRDVARLLSHPDPDGTSSTATAESGGVGGTACTILSTGALEQPLSPLRRVSPTAGAAQMSMSGPQGLGGRDAPAVSKPRSPMGFSQTPVNDPSSVLGAPTAREELGVIGNTPGPQAGASRFHAGLRTPTRQRLLPAQQPPAPLSRPLVFSCSGGRATGVGTVERPQA